MAQVRAALTRLGMSPEAAVFSTNANGMNLGTLDEWRDFNADEDLYGLSKSYRSPGGHTMVAGVLTPNRGYLVNPVTIGNLKVMRLALKHYMLTSRDIIPADVTMEWIHRWEFLVDFRKETGKKKPEDAVLPKIVMSDWAKTKERLINHFSEVYGQDGVPLAYLMRDNAAVPLEINDPHDGYNEDHIKELIARAPHDGAAYRADNRSLCRLLKTICEDTPAHEYISRHSTDGRAAWTALLGVYLGPQHTQNQAALFEQKLQNSTYDGESNNFSFDKYCEIHQQAHTRLDGLVQHGYTGIDEGTKIRHFLKGIKSEKLKTVIELVRSNPAYTHFDVVARRFKDTIIQLRPTKPHSSRRVSAVIRGNDGTEMFAGVEADMSMEDKFYSRPAWANLTQAQKKGVMAKRQARGGQPRKKTQGGGGGGGSQGGSNKSKGGDSGKRKISNINKKLAKMERKISAMNIGSDTSGSESSSDEEAAPPKKKGKKGGNRNNPAVNRRGGRG